jgi:predicted  nucleic acid-binding Zn-ribbon protein
MKKLLEVLLELQKLQLSAEPLSLAAESQANELRAQVPKPILDHFDRLIAQGKTGVAMARNGVCCGCHLRLCSGTAAGLAHQADIHICDHCGRYLYLAPDEPEAAKAPPPPVEPKPKAHKKRKTTRLALVTA